MTVNTLLTADEVVKCETHEQALAVLKGLRYKGIPHSSTGRVDPTVLTPLQGSAYTKATFAAMQAHYRDVLYDIYDFLVKENDPTRELTDDEYYAVNMLLLLCEDV